MVITYFEIGRMIIEEEQNGKERAAYGKQLIAELSKKLMVNFGKSFSQRNLGSAPRLNTVSSFRGCCKNLRVKLFSFLMMCSEDKKGIITRLAPALIHSKWRASILPMLFSDALSVSKSASTASMIKTILKTMCSVQPNFSRMPPQEHGMNSL